MSPPLRCARVCTCVEVCGGPHTGVQRFVGLKEMIQCPFGMRRSLHREMSRVAFDADMTMRAFVLNALKKGVSRS